MTEEAADGNLPQRQSAAKNNTALTAVETRLQRQQSLTGTRQLLLVVVARLLRATRTLLPSFWSCTARSESRSSSSSSSSSRAEMSAAAADISQRTNQ